MLMGGYVIGQMEADAPGKLEEKFRNATQTGAGLTGAGVEPAARGAGVVGATVANTAEGAPAPAGQ